MAHRSSSFIACARDIIVIGVLLAVLNTVLSAKDFGWLGLNPTPWLLLPILIGARYGLASGTISGLLDSLCIVVVRGGPDEAGMRAFAGSQMYELLALVLLGFLAGQWQQLQKSRHAELQTENKGISDQLSSSRSEVALALITRQDLQRKLALHNVVLANLDEDLRKIMAVQPGEFLPSLLDLLHRHGGITSAAFYQAEGTRLTRLAALHPTAPLAAALNLNQTPLAAKALDERSVASVKEPIVTTKEQPFLAAFPFSDGQASGVLLVQDLPLDAMSWENLSRVELILHWTFSLARWRRRVAGSQRQQVIPMQDFMVLIGEALRVDQTHQLPSVVLRADFLDATEANSAKAEKALLACLPQTAISTRLPGTKSLAVLIPFGGQSEGETLIRDLKKAGPQLNCYHYLTTGTEDVQGFWSHVMAE